MFFTLSFSNGFTNPDSNYENGMALVPRWQAESHMEEKIINVLQFVFDNNALDTIFIQKLQYTE
jgi:hypothetical protein